MHVNQHTCYLKYHMYMNKKGFYRTDLFVHSKVVIFN